MSYTLNVHVPESEPYTGLYTYDDIRSAVEQEASNTVDELGSDILDTDSEEERELTIEQLTDDALTHLLREPIVGERTSHRLPGPLNHLTGVRDYGVLLSLVEVE
jgi:hypothetical protein